MRPRRNIPGPRALPIVGSPWVLRHNVLDRLQGISRRFGDTCAFRIGRQQLIFFGHPDDIEEVLVRQRAHTHKDTVTQNLSNLLGQGLLTSEGAHWRKQRRRIAPSLQPRHLEGYADAMVQSARERMPAPGELDLQQLTHGITLDIVLRTLFGSEPDGEAALVAEQLETLMAAFEREQRTVWRLIPKWVPARHRAAVLRVAASLDVVMAEQIARGRARQGDDLLCRLLAARDDDGSAMTDTEVRDEMLTLFLAGHETTSLALAFSGWLLAEHPEIQERAHAEVVEHIGDRPPRFGDTRALSYTGAVIDEVLRLYPPAWAVGRQVMEPFSVGDTALQVGDQVLACQWVVHRDPRFWIGPSRFRPERWLNGETDDLPRMAYFPFGGGQRVCVGNHFARMEMVLVLATLLQQRRFVPVAGYEPELRAAVTLRPKNGVWVTLEDRAQS